MNSEVWIVIISLFGLSFATRALPFLFGNWMTERLSQMGKQLPAYIMMLLVIYEIDIKTITTPPYALPAFIALGLVVITHVWLRQMFLSLSVGVGSYLLINALWF